MQATKKQIKMSLETNKKFTSFQINRSIKYNGINAFFQRKKKIDSAMNNLHACTKSVALHQVNKRHESDEGIFISNFAEKFLKRM